MEKLFYSVEVIDKEDKLYKNINGNNVCSFDFEDTKENESIVHLICQRTYRNYQAICKEGSQINITVSYFNNLTKTYPTLYSFYGAENKFIKH